VDSEPEMAEFKAPPREMPSLQEKVPAGGGAVNKKIVWSTNLLTLS
jgi:hypothetical protein